MSDSVNSVDILQMSIVLYTIKKAQSIEEETTNALIQKTLQKMEENKELIKELDKDITPWLGKSIDIKV